MLPLYCPDVPVGLLLPTSAQADVMIEKAITPKTAWFRKHSYEKWNLSMAGPQLLIINWIAIYYGASIFSEQCQSPQDNFACRLRMTADMSGGRWHCARQNSSHEMF
jgi:hypothetical protein